MTLKGEKPRNFFSSVEKLKITAILTESIRKLGLLGKINQSHDNSSELAGFEINKLLKEQARRESSYNSLISRKSKLKGISNKEQFDRVSLEIRDTSMSLKECTKKLSRLFKENKNLDEDVMKVKNERISASEFISSFIDTLAHKDFDDFEERIFGELQGHNKLEEFQHKEKELCRKIKKLRQELSVELKNFHGEIEMKNVAVDKLKDELQKLKNKSSVKIKYKTKELQAEENSETRLYSQEQERMLIEKKNIEEMIKRENIVAYRNKEFLNEKHLKLTEDLEIARVS